MSQSKNQDSVERPSRPSVSPHREWISYAEATELVGLGRTTLWKLVGTGDRGGARGTSGEDQPAEPLSLHEAFGRGRRCCGEVMSRPLVEYASSRHVCFRTCDCRMNWEDHFGIQRR